MSEEERKRIEKLIEVLLRHQDQHQKMYDSLEGIRWKFITSFGFGAGLALFFSPKGSLPDESQDILFLSLAIVVIVSFAALITQIRIYGLLYAIFRQIGHLQEREEKLLAMLTNEDTKINNDLLVIPGSNKDTNHLLTVHMSTCLIFCCFIGLSVIAFLRSNEIIRSNEINWCLFLIVSFILASSAWGITFWYAKHLSSD